MASSLAFDVSFEQECLVYRGFHHTPGGLSAEVEVALGTRDEGCQAQLQAMEVTEIEIRSVHHIEGTRFDRQGVEDGGFVGTDLRSEI
jgi:hypothetical protein